MIKVIFIIVYNAMVLLTVPCNVFTDVVHVLHYGRLFYSGTTVYVLFILL